MQKTIFRKILIISTVLFYSFFVSAQKNSWNAINKEEISLNNSELINYDINLKKSQYYELDKVSIKNKLDLAPLRENTTQSNVIISMPNENGDYDQFKMFKVQTLAEELANNYPGIYSYVGRSVDNRDASLLRITITPFGFYAMVQKPNLGQFFINPYDKNGQYYVAFEKSNAIDLTKSECTFEEIAENDEFAVNAEFENQTFVVDDGNLRTYSLALACTGEYAQFHIAQAGVGGGSTAQQISAVLSAMVVSIDRINSLYERDLGTTLQLIPNNDQLIFFNASTDPYTNNSGGLMLGENQTTVDAFIGSNNYNIGHVFSTGGGGIASFASICVNGAKARGVTGLPTPVGDPFDIDFVAHEIGHQFGANHTQNNNCQRNNFTAVEPGSGNTIMGYAGICPPNVQGNSDAHFHQISINQIYSNITTGSGASCGSSAGQTNTAPSIIPVPNYTIPNGTAFYLDVTATDAENDALTYNWEQLDNDVSQQPPVTTSTVGPNFRSLPSSTESRRYFPNFDDVLDGNLAPTWEVVPIVARSMNFVVTVRDNNVNVGQSSRELVVMNFANVGPFQVTSQNTQNINWLPGETRTITWNVAGTTANGINTSNVNILLSTDGGQNFNTVLVSNTANDGTQDIVVPTSIQAPFCRIMIEPVNNVYYAVNSEPFAIDTSITNDCNTYVNSSSVAIPDGGGTPQNPQQGQLASSIINIPDNISNITDVNVTLNVSHTYINDLVFQLQAPDGDFIVLWSRNCNSEDGMNITFNDNGVALPAPGTDCANPLSGTYAPVDTDDDLATIFSSGTQGNWALVFADFFPQDIGTLNSWEIEICSTTFSVEDNNLNNFTISPNPNNGVFDLNFNQPLGNDANISIYDIQGRLVEKVDYETSSSTMRIQLENQYQSGVYLLEVANGNNKSVSKLIIR